MSFVEPLWLLALTIVPLVWWMHSRGIGAVSKRQRTAAALVRSLIVVCIVLSLAGTSLSLKERRLATVFVVDVSDSMSGAARSDAESFVRRALETKPADALAGVVAFGGDARVELIPQEEADLVTVSSRPDPSRTDLARAMRLAAAVMPEGARRRIVVLSDGRENSGDSRTEASSLFDRGLRIDAVEASGSTGEDAAVLDVSAPSRVRIGDRFEITASISATSQTTGRLTLERDGEVIETRRVVVGPGEEEVSFAQTASEQGSAVYRVELDSAQDSVAQNDSAAALVLVSGRPRVMVLEAGLGEGKDIEDALGDRGFIVERRPVQEFPSGEELAAIGSIVLVDVPAETLTTAQLDTLEGFVRDLGRGLVTIGGESSWSLGAYSGSRLEDLLPLRSEIKDPRRRPSIAQVLAIDTSGSMTACHCADPNSMREEGGVNKTDISRSAAARAIDALTEQDEVGVLAFDTRSRWAIPLGQVPSEEVVTAGLESLRPRGGTNIPQALKAAVRELRSSKASLKHIVMFTDGFTERRLGDVAAWVRRQGITLSVLATGEGSGDQLKRMAQQGGGRYYAGRNLHEIPEILMNEVVVATRRYINEGTFFPTVTGSSAAVDRLTSTPPILGYVGTSSKPSAGVLLSVGRYEDPLLATWRTGLGVVTSWTSDAKARWSSEWIDWAGFAGFWSDVVRETLPASPDPSFSAQASTSDDGLEITVESDEPIPEGSRTTARVVGPDGSTTRLDLARSGVDTFRGESLAASPGAYLVSVDVSDDGRSLYRETLGAVRSYSSEYRPGDPDDTLLKEIADNGGGRFDISPAAAFDPDLPVGRRHIDISSWLILLAALLLPLDIALRRVIVGREDLKALRSRRLRKKSPDLTRSDEMARLLRVKQRATAPAAPAPPAPSPPAPTTTASPETSPSAAPTRTSRPATDAAPAAPTEDSATGVSELLKRRREAKRPREDD